MKTLLAAAALLVASLGPATAADDVVYPDPKAAAEAAAHGVKPAAPAPPDETYSGVIGAWNDMDRGRINLRNSILALAQLIEGLRSEVAQLRDKCGAACVEPPAEPAKPEPKPAPKPAKK